MQKVWRYCRLFVPLAVIVGLVLYFTSNRTDQSGEQYRTAQVRRGPIQAKVSATGTLAARVTVQVGTQVSGRVQELFVDFNSPVHKGQVIARIDPRLFQTELEQRKAAYMVAKANVEKAVVQEAEARRQYERARALFEKRLISEAEADTARANADAAKAAVVAAKAAVAQASAALKQAEVNLAYTTIVSPIDGVVISRNVDVGQTVAAAFQAPTIFTIAEDLRKMQVHCNVAEADVGRIRAGMKVTFTVDAWPSDTFEGVVHEVRNAPQTIQNVVTYDVVLDVENQELKLKPGMTANVTFVVAERADALLVPNAAIRFRPPGAPEERGSTRRDQRKVWRLEPATPNLTPVTVRVGMTDGNFTEVVEGDLKEGDLVVTEVLNGKANGGNVPRFKPL